MPSGFLQPTVTVRDVVQPPLLPDTPLQVGARACHLAYTSISPSCELEILVISLVKELLVYHPAKE